jgi:hypothetical protein
MTKILGPNGRPLGSMSEQPSTNVLIEGGRITGLRELGATKATINELRIKRLVLDVTPFRVLVAAAAGTITEGSADGEYFPLGPLHIVRFTATIPVNGTGATAVLVELPAAATIDSVLHGRETGASGAHLQGFIAAGSRQLYIYAYDNAYPGFDGAELEMGGMYQ